MADRDVRIQVLEHCQSALPRWRDLTVDDVDFADPRGFSSFTMAVRPRVPVEPPALMYRRLAGKDNAILDFDSERAVFLALGQAGLAARCLHYGEDFRLEQLLDGDSLVREDVFDPVVARKLAGRLWRFHRLALPESVPTDHYFDRIHRDWGALVRDVLTRQRDQFPADEQPLCEPLLRLLTEQTRRKVADFLPDEQPVFCHNDTYFKNVMRLRDDTLALVDFEFSCLSHRAYDFSNFFAETVTRHGLADPPHFDIVAPDFDASHVRALIDPYVAHDNLPLDEHAAEVERLVEQTLSMIPLSDYTYAMAAIPLALEPIQTIRFLPYAARRFARFESAWQARFG